MAAVARMTLIVAGIWTALSFMVAMGLGRIARRLEPARVRVRAERPRVVDVRRAR